jgi:3-deoxy-D-manno-octulosonate 8-phosphate phosphatase (KDO 8-P phosphatase)
MSGDPSNTPGTTRGAGQPLPPRAALAAIQLLLLDVDGVLTDGRVHFDREGREYKSFHVQDAAGIVYWHRSGGLSGFVSGRGGDAVELRARELGVHEVHLQTKAKGAVLRDILQRRGLQPAQVGCVGDDLLDLQILRHVGFAATVPEGRDEVKQCCHYVAARPAGFGAVRDVVELLLRARGAWDGIVSREGLP